MPTAHEECDNGQIKPRSGPSLDHLDHLDGLYPKVVKRAIDLVVATVALMALLPFLLLVAFLVKLTSSGPVFFRQVRLGHRGKLFQIYKFRTMTDKMRTANREIIGNDPELTIIGGCLRRLKIDELPQLLNILFGDMSIVGPRPAVPEHLSLYTETAFMRLLVKPGLTGLAQVNGNIHISWADRWEYDRQYVECISLSLDLQICFKTIAILVMGEDKFVQSPYV